jgi:hypothetical protein
VQLVAAAGRSLEVQIHDGTGGLRLLFMGRTHIAGVTPGTVLRVSGQVGEFREHLAIANRTYGTARARLTTAVRTSNAS